MRSLKWICLSTLILLVSGWLPLWALAAPDRQEALGPNLLYNADFEMPEFPMQDGIPEVQVAPGWRAWYLDYPPSYIVPPNHCFTKEGKLTFDGCFWMRPEFRGVARASDPNRVHGGLVSQKYFSYIRMHEGGLYQQVNNVPVGAKLRFAIHIQAWMCGDFSKCKNGYVSDAPGDMHLRIGIDPTGGTDPFSPNIVWSYEVPAWDQWVRFQVEAISQSSTVTVFTHSRPEWTDNWARENNDVYLDDAELYVVEENPQPTEAPVNQPQVAPEQPLPPRQPVARADGTMVHQVVFGDTLLGIALAYGTTVDDIVRLNNLNPGDFLQIGQELVVKAPAGWAAPAQQPLANPAPVAQAAPTPAPAPPGQAAPAAEPTAAAMAAPAGLCVTAFEDQNMNTLYDNNEGLVAGTRFDVLEGTAVVQSHVTDGSEPFCFSGLASGTYIVAVQSASGYKATSVEKIGVSVASGQTTNVVFGSISTGKPASGSAEKSASTSTGAVPVSSPPPNIGGVLVSISGLLVLIAAGVVGFMLVSRRQI